MDELAQHLCTDLAQLCHRLSQYEFPHVKAVVQRSLYYMPGFLKGSEDTVELYTDRVIDFVLNGTFFLPNPATGGYLPYTYKQDPTGLIDQSMYIRVLLDEVWSIPSENPNIDFDKDAYNELHQALADDGIDMTLIPPPGPSY